MRRFSLILPLCLCISYGIYAQDTIALRQYKQEAQSLKTQLALLENKIKQIEMAKKSANTEKEVEEIYPKYGDDVQYITHEKTQSPANKVTKIDNVVTPSIDAPSKTTDMAKKIYYVVIGSSNSKDWSATMPNFIRLGYTNTKLLYSPSANWYNLVINTPYYSKKEVFQAMEQVRAEGKIPGAWWTAE